MRVVVGMSGGVDSAVAALLLQEQGCEVLGVTLLTWRMNAAGKGEKSAEQAADVARGLGIPLHVHDVRTRFYRDVVQPFAEAYAGGETPNPCVLCNPTLKFAVLLDEAERLKARWIATGHYARVEHAEDGPSRLLRAPHRKDQSYALYRLTQRHLTRLRLPLGDLPSKAAVREEARQRGLPVAEEEDSQDLCFVDGGDYRPLLETIAPVSLEPGPIYDEAGVRLGTHEGLPFYTIGQRGGLGIAAPVRLYVLRLVPEENALIVGPRERLERTGCELREVTFTAGEAPATTFEAEGRIRYRAPLVPVEVALYDSNAARIRFTIPQVGIAPGQSLVLYRGAEVLGGGIIAATEQIENV